MSESLLIRRQVHLRQIHRQKRGRGEDPSAGRVPRVARLLALAIYIDELVERGDVAGYAQLARRIHVSRARIAQITSLRFLSPDIQEKILFLPPVSQGPDPITERDLRPIAAQPEWRQQRLMWIRLTGGKRNRDAKNPHCNRNPDTSHVEMNSGKQATRAQNIQQRQVASPIGPSTE